VKVVQHDEEHCDAPEPFHVATEPDCVRHRADPGQGRSQVAHGLLTDGGEAIILISTRDAEDLDELIAAAPALGFVPKSELSAVAIERLVSGPRET
jgi:hypothetical protein